MKGANKDMADSLFWWGTGKIYKFGVAVNETSWNRVKDDKKLAYDKKLSTLAKKIAQKQGRVKPSVKTKVIFNFMSIMQKNGFNKPDMEYWKEKGWTGKNRPW